MKPFKKAYPKVERFNTPYPKSVLKLYPRLTKYPWNGKIIGDGYGTPTGTPILSPTPGTVTFAGTDSTGSKTVDYTYKGMRVRMGHHSRVDVKRGQKLGWQTQVGLSGKSGMATHPHLYIQVNKGKTAINPDVVIKLQPFKPSLVTGTIKIKGIGKALASELGSRLLGRKWVAPASFSNLLMDKFIQAIRKSAEYKKKRGTNYHQKDKDELAIVNRELGRRTEELATANEKLGVWGEKLTEYEAVDEATRPELNRAGFLVEKISDTTSAVKGVLAMNTRLTDDIIPLREESRKLKEENKLLKERWAKEINWTLLAKLIVEKLKQLGRKDG